MKATIKLLGAVILGGGFFITGCAKEQMVSFHSLKDPELAAQLKSFVAEKEAQANGATNRTPAEIQAFFALATKGDWPAVSNAFMELRKQAGWGVAWQAVLETFGALEAFGEGDEKYSMVFGTNLIASIPAGSIYFGGTDPGLFIIAALQNSQARAEPFFTIAQGRLPDAGYLEYLRGMYGEKIYTPTDEDLKKCREDYTQDAAQRRSENQLRPGEEVAVGADGNVQVSGQMARIAVKSLMAKNIFDKNPGREFYFEESFPFDWMQPYLEPHGLIFKLNRQPLPGLSDKIAEQNHDYWLRLVRPMIGDWLTDSTSVESIAAFAKKTFGKQDFSGFTGDRRFIQNTYSQRMFSKLRNSHAGLYAWRLQHATGPAEKERMARESDLAFRQAWALCPDSTEAVFRYVAWLMEQKRVADALLVAETAAQMSSMQARENQPMRDLVLTLKQSLRTSQTSSGGK